MNKISFESIIAIVGPLVGIISIFLGYKIRKQQKKINIKTLDKIDQDQIKTKKANLLVTFSKVENKLSITNDGGSDARYVNVSFPHLDDHISIRNNPSPINILVGDIIEISLIICSGGPNILEVNLTWEDSYTKENIMTRSVQL